MQGVDDLCASLKTMTSLLYQIISSMQFIQTNFQVWVKFPNNFTYMQEANNQTWLLSPKGPQTPGHAAHIWQVATLNSLQSVYIFTRRVMSCEQVSLESWPFAGFQILLPFGWLKFLE